MAISIELIKQLREETGAGVLDCRNALEQSGGDFSMALEQLRERRGALRVPETRKPDPIRSRLPARFVGAPRRRSFLILRADRARPCGTPGRESGFLCSARIGSRFGKS